MNNNLETLIRAIVPLSFMAIWALTSLFNRESKARPAAAPPRPGSAPRPRPANDPTLRFASRTAPAAGGGRRDDEVVILSSSTMIGERTKPARPPGAGTPRRPARGRPAVPERKAEPASTRTRLAGVTQNVNQQLANANIDLAPLTALPPVAALTPLDAASTADPAPMPMAFDARGGIAAGLRDPARLREAFIANEILRRPVALRGRGGPRGA